MIAKTIYKRLLEERTMVLATASSKGIPQAATVLFTEKDDIIYFYTFDDSRKYDNLISNPKASVVLHGDGYAQLDGTVQELFGKDAENAKMLIVKKKNSDSKFDQDLRARYFSFTPTWIRVMTKESYPATYALLDPSRQKNNIYDEDEVDYHDRQ